MGDITVHLDDELYDKASRVARLDNVSVKELVEDVRRRHLDYVEVVEDFSKCRRSRSRTMSFIAMPTKAMRITRSGARFSSEA